MSQFNLIFSTSLSNWHFFKMKNGKKVKKYEIRCKSDCFQILACFLLVYKRRPKMKNTNIYDEESSALSIYFNDISKNTSLISEEEEERLSVLAKQGDEIARNKLIESNLRFVVKIAKQFQGRGLPLEDLIQEGSLGLTIAIDKFQPELGYKFISYAVWWIRQSIQKAISEKTRMIRLPMNRTAEWVKINRAKHEMEANGLETDDSSIAEACGLDEETVRNLTLITSEMSSLDAPVSHNGSTAIFGDFLESDVPTPEEFIVDSSLSEDVYNALQSLEKREREILILRFGLGNRKPLSLKEVGEIFGLTKERIRQIEKKAISKLSNNSEFSHLKAYIA